MWHSPPRPPSARVPPQAEGWSSQPSTFGRSQPRAAMPHQTGRFPPQRRVTPGIPLILVFCREGCTIALSLGAHANRGFANVMCAVPSIAVGKVSWSIHRDGCGKSNRGSRHLAGIGNCSPNVIHGNWRVFVAKLGYGRSLKREMSRPICRAIELPFPASPRRRWAYAPPPRIRPHCERVEGRLLPVRLRVRNLAAMERMPLEQPRSTLVIDTAGNLFGTCTFAGHWCRERLQSRRGLQCNHYDCLIRLHRWGGALRGRGD